MLELKIVKINKTEEVNVIIGQSHFIKTAEDLYEALVSSAPGVEFGVSFSEASGKCLVRVEGNNEELKKLSAENCLNIGSGHVFVILMRKVFPINVLNAIKGIPEVCGIYCATANEVEVIVAQTGKGRGVLGVVDGLSPKGMEGEGDIIWRKNFLRNIGYKL